MNDEDIHKIIFSKKIPGSHGEFDLKETHISWILLHGKFAFKIKKPVRLPFLDFSTLHHRKFFCEREITLNSRFSKGIYFKVVPVKKYNNCISIGERKGEIIDYAVMMKRLNSQKQMDFMLEENKVTKIYISKLAKKISLFHKKALIIENDFNTSTFQDLFIELSFYKEFIKEHLGSVYYQIVSKAEKKSESFLSNNKKLFNDRVKKGLVRDCHGDLHSRNIFLYASPILFDCIEFNDEYRYIDVLYEIAFLCMDLDSYGRFNLSTLFRKHYLSDFGLRMNKEELQLFYYYKSCRANIRAKVNIIKALEIKDKDYRFENILSEIKIYLDLIKLYNSYY
jgi:aminoglycoside phosphotransferase family enzyme